MCARRTLAIHQKRKVVEVERIASAAVGGGCALAAKSFINGEGEGGGVIMCNRDSDTDGASVGEDGSESEIGERVGGVEASVGGLVVFDNIVRFLEWMTGETSDKGERASDCASKRVWVVG